MKPKTCEQCGTTYTPTSGRAKRCPPCRSTGPTSRAATAPEVDLSESLRTSADCYADAMTDAEALVESARERLRWRARRGAKRCQTCRTDKPVSAFGLNGRFDDGLNRTCRACRSSVA